MIEELVLILIAVGILAVLYYFLKNLTTLIVNSIIGLIMLFAFNHFNILGLGDVPLTWMSVLVCALGGLPGAILVILFHAAGLM